MAGAPSSSTDGGAAAELERRRLLERVQEQETVIRQLWDRYRQDVGREPDVNDLVADAGPRAAAARTAETLKHVLGQEQLFDAAVDELELQWTRCFSEASEQRVGVKLLHDRKPVVTIRRACDVNLRGFWGRGVSMPAFERLLEKLRPAHIYRLDLSDNGLTGNFVPGVVEVLRRGVRQLDLSQNALESQAAVALLHALPRASPLMESLDLRFNPCQGETGYLEALSNAVQQLKCLNHLAVTVRCDASTSTVSSAQPAAPHAAGAPEAAPQRRQSGGATAPQQRPASAGGLRAGTRRKSPGRTSPQRPWRSPGEGGSWSRAHRFGPERDEAAGGLRPLRGRSVSQSGASPKSPGRARETRARDPAGGQHQPGERLDGTSAAVLFFRAIAQSHRLRELDLRSSYLTRTAVQRLAHHIRDERCQIMTLGMADCFLGEAVLPLLGAVEQCRGLVKLSLRLNALTDREGIPLCRALAQSVSLTDVDLASNELGDDFGTKFAKVVANNDVLWKVDLARNPLGSATGDALLAVLIRRRSTLVSIGDTTESLSGLGLQNRRQIQRFLGENSHALEAPKSQEEAKTQEGINGLRLEDFEWSILEDLPRPLEPLTLLL